LPKERYGDSLVGRGSTPNLPIKEADTTAELIAEGSEARDDRMSLHESIRHTG